MKHDNAVCEPCRRVRIFPRIFRPTLSDNVDLCEMFVTQILMTATPTQKGVKRLARILAYAEDSDDWGLITLSTN